MSLDAVAYLFLLVVGSGLVCAAAIGVARAIGLGAAGPAPVRSIEETIEAAIRVARAAAEGGDQRARAEAANFPELASALAAAARGTPAERLRDEAVGAGSRGAWVNVLRFGSLAVAAGLAMSGVVAGALGSSTGGAALAPTVLIFAILLTLAALPVLTWVAARATIPAAQAPGAVLTAAIAAEAAILIARGEGPVAVGERLRSLIPPSRGLMDAAAVRAA